MVIRSVITYILLKLKYFLLLLFLSGASFTTAFGQVIDVPLGEQEYVGPSPTFQNSWCPLKQRQIVDSLSKDFVEISSSVYFAPTRLGLQTDTFAIYADPANPDDINCSPGYAMKVYKAIGVSDTLMRVRPRTLQSTLKADLDARVYRDTFTYSFENKLASSVAVNSWKLEGVSSLDYELRIFDSLSNQVSALALLPQTRRSLTFVLTMSIGPFWHDTTIETRLVSQLNGQYDSVFSNPLTLVIKRLSPTDFARPLFTKSVLTLESGDLDSVTVRYFARPYVDLTLEASYPFSVTSRRIADDTIQATIYCGPSVSGTFNGKITAKWDWTGFGAIMRQDLIAADIGAVVSKLRLSKDTLAWSGPIEDAPVTSNAFLNKASMRYFYLSLPSIFAAANFQIAADSIRFAITHASQHFGRYRDKATLTYQVIARDGRSAKDSVSALIDLDLHADQWVLTGWNSSRTVNGIAASRRDTVYVASGNELHRSTNKGNTWQLFESFKANINQFHVTGRGGVGLYFADHTGAYLSPSGELIDLTVKTRPQTGGYQTVTNLDAADDGFSVMSVSGNGYMFYLVSDDDGFSFDTIGECRGLGTLAHSRSDKRKTIFSLSDARIPDCGAYFPGEWRRPVLAQLGSYYGGDANGLKYLHNGRIDTLYHGEITSISGKNGRIAFIRAGELLYLSSNDSAHVSHISLSSSPLRLTTLSDSEIYVVTADGKILRSDIKAPKSSVGMAQRRVATLHIYPNPVSDLVRIDLPYGSTKVIVRDLLGRVVIERSTEGADIRFSNFMRGAYIVEAFDNFGILLAKGHFVTN